jgi:hypothetical protein
MPAVPLRRYTGSGFANAPSAVFEAATCVARAKSAASGGLWTTATPSITRTLRCRQVGALLLVARQQCMAWPLSHSVTSPMADQYGSMLAVPLSQSADHARRLQGVCRSQMISRRADGRPQKARLRLKQP